MSTGNGQMSRNYAVRNESFTVNVDESLQNSASSKSDEDLGKNETFPAFLAIIYRTKKCTFWRANCPATFLLQFYKQSYVPLSNPIKAS